MCDLLLGPSVKLSCGSAAGSGRAGLLDQVKDGNTVTDRRKKTGSIWGEEKIALAIDCPQKIREL